MEENSLFKETRGYEPLHDYNKSDLDAKYAPVHTPFAESPIVSIHLAKQLKKVGFDERCSVLYDLKEGVTHASFEYPRTTKRILECEDFAFAPTIYHAKDWLAKQGIVISAFTKHESEEVTENGKTYKVKRSDGWWYRAIYTTGVYNGKVGMYRVKSPINPFKSEADALSIAIREGINIVKKIK